MLRVYLSRIANWRTFLTRKSDEFIYLGPGSRHYCFRFGGSQQQGVFCVRGLRTQIHPSPPDSESVFSITEQRHMPRADIN